MTAIASFTQKGFSCFLLDAAGVVYNDKGAIPGIAETVRIFQTIGPVFLVTNNSFLNPSTIQTKLKALDIQLPISHILTSGYGLSKDPDIAKLMHNKKVFIVGKPDCYPYAEMAQVARIVDTPEDSNVIAFMGYTASTQALFFKAADFLKQTDRHNVVCCNPDRMVFGKDGLQHVIGHHTESLEKECGFSFKWFGKPHSNFNAYIKSSLAAFDIPLDKRVVFCDDNPENVVSMQRDLGITGCHIQETGIGSLMDFGDGLEAIDLRLPSLSFDLSHV